MHHGTAQAQVGDQDSHWRHGGGFARSRRAVKPRSRERRAAGAGLDGEERAPSYHCYCRDARSL